MKSLALEEEEEIVFFSHCFIDYLSLDYSKMALDLDKLDNNDRQLAPFPHRLRQEIYVDDKQSFPRHIHNDDIH